MKAVANNTVDDILKLPYARVFIRENGGWSASVREFKGCYALGRTVQEAMDALELEMTAWVTSHPIIPDPIAQGEAYVFEPLEKVEDWSGWSDEKTAPDMDSGEVVYYREHLKTRKRKELRRESAW